jgi:hypothetical protein
LEKALKTPDGRYLVVRGRLWRSSNPALSEDVRQSAVDALMSARRAVKVAAPNSAAMKLARSAVHAAKLKLGERGPVWWTDDSPDYNRHMAENTPYARWFAENIAIKQ